GHAFLNEGEWATQKRKELGFVGGENVESKKLAWERIFGFFDKYLG
ncbi:11076_t:CDS:1, partial [Acaulospora morrowiae]